MKVKQEIVEEYEHYLKLPYDIFKSAVHLSGFWDEKSAYLQGWYAYSYDVGEKQDCDETRLAYIEYLVNEKGFKL